MAAPFSIDEYSLAAGEGSTDQRGDKIFSDPISFPLNELYMEISLFRLLNKVYDTVSHGLVPWISIIYCYTLKCLFR